VTNDSNTQPHHSTVLGSITLPRQRSQLILMWFDYGTQEKKKKHRWSWWSWLSIMYQILANGGKFLSHVFWESL